MADGLMYPTGVSRQPIDVVSGAQAFLQSAVESRLGEIESSKQQISENAKNIMKAMSIKALPELANEQRARYQKKIEDYRQEVIGKFRDSGGKLTLQQQKEIQDGFVDLEQSQLSELNQLKQFQEFQKLSRDPNFKYGYNAAEYAKVMGDAYSRLMKGEGIGDLSASVYGTMLKPSVGDYVAKRYSDAISRLDIEALGEFKGNVFTATEVQNKKEVIRLRDEIMADPNVTARFVMPDGRVDEEKRAQTQQLVEDYINKKITEVKPYRQTTGGGSSKSTVTAKFKDVTYGDRTYDDLVSIESTPKYLAITDTYNTSTGKREPKPNGFTGRIIGLAPRSNKALVMGEGEQAIKSNDGKQLFVRSYDSDTSVEYQKKNGFSEADLKDKNKMEGMMSAAMTSEYDKFDYDVIPNNDGSFTIKAVFTKEGEKRRNGTYKKEPVKTPISVTLMPAVARGEDVVYEVNVADYPEIFDKVLDSYYIDGKYPLRGFLGQQKEGQSKQAKKPKFNG